MAEWLKVDRFIVGFYLIAFCLCLSVQPLYAQTMSLESFAAREKLSVNLIPFHNLNWREEKNGKFQRFFPLLDRTSATPPKKGVIMSIRDELYLESRGEAFLDSWLLPNDQLTQAQARNLSGRMDQIQRQSQLGGPQFFGIAKILYPADKNRAGLLIEEIRGPRLADANKQAVKSGTNEKISLGVTDLLLRSLDLGFIPLDMSGKNILEENGILRPIDLLLKTPQEILEEYEKSTSLGEHFKAALNTTFKNLRNLEPDFHSPGYKSSSREVCRRIVESLPNSRLLSD